MKSRESAVRSGQLVSKSKTFSLLPGKLILIRSEESWRSAESIGIDCSSSKRPLRNRLDNVLWDSRQNGRKKVSDVPKWTWAFLIFFSQSNAKLVSLKCARGSNEHFLPSLAGNNPVVVICPAFFMILKCQLNSSCALWSCTWKFFYKIRINCFEWLSVRF